MILFLNDVAGSEVLLIVLFILIFFGSKSIPSIARTVGRTMRQIQNASSDIQHEIKKTAGEYTKELKIDSILKETAQEITTEITTPLDQAINDLEHSVQYQPKTQKKDVLKNSDQTIEKILNNKANEQQNLPNNSDNESV